MTEPADSFEEFSVLDRPEPEAHLSDYWKIVVKYRRLVILCLLGALIAAVVFTLLSTPLYQASVVLDVTRQGSTSLGLGGDVPIEIGTEFLPSQVEILNSRDVAERTVRRLDLLSNKEFLEAYPDLAPDEPAPAKGAKPAAPKPPS